MFMNLKLYNLVLLSICSITLIAQPNIHSQLCSLNKEWQSVEPEGELLENRQFLSEQEIITYHLQQVEKHLTKKNIEHLIQEVQQRRKEGLEVLRAYWKRGLYPKNNQFNFRIPFFIDYANTACAVGYIMQGTGYEALAQNIAETQNNAYVKEMIDDNILEWANNYGFTVDELALIQPSYGPCNGLFSGVYEEKVVQPTCGKNNGSIKINETGVTSYKWEHGASGLELNNLPAGIYRISGTYIDILNNYDQCCPFWLEIVLESENKPVVKVNSINHQSCYDVADGKAEVEVTKAIGNYSIEWPGGSTNHVASNLTAGQQYVSVTDAMNCTAFGYFFIAKDSLLSREKVTGTICNNNTGSVNLNMIEYYDPKNYYFNWADGNTSESRTNMAAGDYTVVISDDSGCTLEKNITIKDDCNGKIICNDDFAEVSSQHNGYIFQFANDLDPFNHKIASFEFTQPANGEVYFDQSTLITQQKISDKNIHFRYTSSGTYTGPDSFTYTVCTNYGFCDSAMVYLNIVNKPVVSISNTYKENLQIYKGDRIIIFMRGAKNYSWFPSTESGSTSSNHVWVSPDETTTYTITGTNEDGQTDAYELTIEVLQPTIIPNFEAFNEAIQIHQDSEKNLVHITGQLQKVDLTVLDAANTVVSSPPIYNNTATIKLSDLTDCLYYLNIQHVDYPNVNTQTIIKQLNATFD